MTNSKQSFVKSGEAVLGLLIFYGVIAGFQFLLFSLEDTFVGGRFLSSVLVVALQIVSFIAFFFAEPHFSWQINYFGRNTKLLLYSLSLPLCAYPLAFYYLSELGCFSRLFQVLAVNLAIFFGQLLLRVLSEEVVLYMVFGGLTTVVSLGSFILIRAVWPTASGVAHDSTWLGPKLFSFCLAILFAFWTNRRFVFQSGGSRWREFYSFVGSRLLTSAVFEFGGLWLLLQLFRWPASLANLFVVFAVIVVNYFLSKYMVFNQEA